MEALLGVCVLADPRPALAPPGAFKDAPLGKAVSYQRVIQILDQMKGCLAAGFPIILGISVCESFESKPMLLLWLRITVFQRIASHD